MGGATPIRWIEEAEDLAPAGTSGTMSGKGGPRATLHCTVSRPTQFLDMHRVLIGKKAEPHLLYSFADDRLGQYFPLDRSARALMGSGITPSGISHNKVGTVNIQIEVVGTTDDWTARPDWRPGPNFRAMMAAIASWGIRPEFIYRPATTSEDRRNVVRSFATMTGSAGGGVWWGHCHYPDGESHWDPGRVNLPRFFAAAYGTATPVPEEDDMPYTPEQLAKAVWTDKSSDVIEAPKANLAKDPENEKWTPASYLYYTYASLQDARAEIAGLTAAVKALAESHGADGAAVVEAVRSEVAKAMQGLEVTLTTPPAPASEG